MSNSRIQKLLDDCRVEMGPEVFREFTDDLAGREKAPVATKKMTCGLCHGDGVSRHPVHPGGKCEGCNGTGKF